MGVSFFTKIEAGDIVVVSNINDEPCGYYREVKLEKKMEKKIGLFG